MMMRRQRSLGTERPMLSLVFILFLWKGGSNKRVGTLAFQQPLPQSCPFYCRPDIGLRAKQQRPDDDNDDEKNNQVGMEEAFRQLEALESLGGDETTSKAAKLHTPTKKLTKPTDMDLTGGASAEDIPLESEIRVYEDMVGELETNEDAEAYRDVLGALGSKQQVSGDGDTYSNVLEEMGGTPSLNSPPIDAASSEEEEIDVETVLPSSVASDQLEELRSEKFMEEALQAALKDVKLKDSGAISDNILDDAEIMKEIEQIFEEGNEKLLESLEEIRAEQQALAAESAQRNAQTKADATDQTAQRFAAAETNMRSMLDRVETERSAVAQAVQDLEVANQQVDKNVLVQLKRGGIPKQLALVGCVLFAGRSIADTITAVAGNDETVLASALVQAVIAVVCAIAFVVI